MLQSKIDRLGGAKDDLRNHLLPPLLNSMNAYVTTDEKSSVSKFTKAPFQVVTVVDPAIVSAGQKDALSSLVWRRQNLNLRRYSSLSESVFLRTPKTRRTPDTQRPLIGNRVLSSSARKNVSETTSFKDRILKLKEIPILKKRVERLREKVKVELEAKALSAKKRQERGSRPSFDDELREGNTSKKKKKYESPEDQSREILYEKRPLEADKMSKSMTIKGGFAAKLAMVKQKEKEIHNIMNMPEKKKKKKVVGPTKFRANLRDFTERIAIEGTDYVMEMYLAPDIIENTRKYNIDITKQPKIVPNSTTAADMRDEYSTYCGQRKSIKNWLYYV